MIDDAPSEVRNVGLGGGRGEDWGKRRAGEEARALPRVGEGHGRCYGVGGVASDPGGAVPAVARPAGAEVPCTKCSLPVCAGHQVCPGGGDATPPRPARDAAVLSGRDARREGLFRPVHLPWALEVCRLCCTL